MGLSWNAMGGQNSHWRCATWGAALGAYAVALTRAGAQLLDDLQLQQTAAIAVLGIAIGPCLGLLPGVRANAERAPRARAWWATLAALTLLVGTFAWLKLSRALPPTDVATCSAALLLASPLCLASYASCACGQAARASLGAWLVGAGLGACAAQLGTEAIGAELVLGQSCLIAALAALLSARPPAATRADRLWLLSGATFIAALVSAISAPSTLSIGPQPPPLGELSRLAERLAALGMHLTPRADDWDGFGHLEAFEIVDRAEHASGMGMLLRDSAVLAPFARAGTTRADGQPGALCSETLVAEPYTQSRARVLLAGVGGGLELQCARERGAKSIEIAEPSRALRQMLRGPLEGWLAGVARDPRVRFHPRSAREIASATATRSGFDLIALAASATKHRLPAGVLPVPIAEAMLTTDRGLSELVGALAPDGVLFAVLQGEPAALRFVTTALSALRLRGLQRPENAIAVHESAGAYGIQVRRTGFALDEVLAMHARNREAHVADSRAPLTEELWRGASGRPLLRYTPGAGFDNHFGALFARANQAEPAPFQAKYLFDLSPATDERPLFHEMTRRDRRDTWLSVSPYSALPKLAIAIVWVALALAYWGWSAGRAPGTGGVRAFVSLLCFGAAQPLAFALALHRLSLLEPERAAVLVLLGMPLGAGLGLLYCQAWLARKPRLGRAAAWFAFVLIAVGLGPALGLAVRTSAWLVAAIGFGAAALLGLALASPASMLHAAAAVTCADRDRAATRTLAVSLLACASAVPTTSALVLLAGYGAVSVAGVVLLALALLLAPRVVR